MLKTMVASVSRIRRRHGDAAIPMRLLIAVIIGLVILFIGISAFMRAKESEKQGTERHIYAYTEIKTMCQMWSQTIQQCSDTGSGQDVCNCDDCRNDFVDGMFHSYEIPFWLYQMAADTSLYFINSSEAQQAYFPNNPGDWDALPDDDKAEYMSLHTQKCMDATNYLVKDPGAANFIDAGKEMAASVKANREVLRVQFAKECAMVCLWVQRRGEGCDFGLVSCEGPPDMSAGGALFASTRMP